MSDARATRPVVDQIEQLVADIPGWTPIDQLLTLHTLAMATAPLGGDLLEIGSWCGRSTSVLGMAARKSGGRVHAIDLFPAKDDWTRNEDGSYSFSVDLEATKVEAYCEQTVWAEPFENAIAPLYQRWNSIADAFTETMTRAAMTDLVIPFRGTAAMFARSAGPHLPVRLAFIDADHSYRSVCRDIEVVEQFLLPGGWIAFDDAFSSYKGVDQAIRDRIIESDRYELGHQATRKLFIARRKI